MQLKDIKSSNEIVKNDTFYETILRCTSIFQDTYKMLSIHLSDIHTELYCLYIYFLVFEEEEFIN